MSNTPITFDVNSHSPMMLQWHACKQTAAEAILLFRLGDFYEAFYEDAHLLSKELDLTLTKRQDIPMSGIPCHTCEGYIDRLVAKGYRVAVAEQMEDPKKTKGIVKREVVRVVTPATLINSTFLSSKSNNFFASISLLGSRFGFTCIDITTGECWISEFLHERELLNELYRIRPSEILSSDKLKTQYITLFQELELSFPFLHSTQEEWHFDVKTTQDFLLKHLQVYTLDGFGLQGLEAATSAAGALLKFLKEGLNQSVNHIQEIRTYSSSSFMTLDRITLKNLEITHSLQDGGLKNTLLSVMDKTLTPMGGRLLSQWIKQPLLSVELIQCRQHAVQNFFDSSNSLDSLRDVLKDVKDIERLVTKIGTGYATPRDLLALSQSFQPMRHIQELLAQMHAPLIQNEAKKIDPLDEMRALVERALVDNPPLKLGDGPTFRDGYHCDLDELRQISQDSKSWMAHYQTRIREETGIKTLKVGFTRVFGYYIEVSRGQANKIPDEFIRRQTLVNAERFITPELKEYESKVLTAEERIEAIENELFYQLKLEISKYSKIILSTAQALSTIDCLAGFAELARTQRYSLPHIDNSTLINIEEGRHPVIESVCLKEKFTANDTLLDDEDHRLLLITGPNMAGKSTYLRQVALIVIMAQVGSFVPAKKATIGIVDKVFTRLGASDDLARGQSTFMVEMTETANILHHVTDRSLVILDEIGRGTSTYDGISIAWSVAEFLLTTAGRMGKTLFATHYWELTKLEEKVPGAVNYHVAVHEAEDHITFLRKIVRGGTDKSYGIHVARLAGLPLEVIERAKNILEHLEENSNRKAAFEPSKPKKVNTLKKKTEKTDLQLKLFS